MQLGSYASILWQLKCWVESNKPLGVLDHYGFGTILKRLGEQHPVDEIGSST
jgi:hypothetical protein